MTTSRWFAGLLLALVALPAGARAQPSAGTTHAAEGPGCEHTRLEAAITLEVRLDVAAWRQASPATDFPRYQPNEGTPPSLPTEVWFLYDDRALYIGARMTQPDGVVAPLARRDQLLDASGDNGPFNSLTTDKLVVRLGPYH